MQIPKCIVWDFDGVICESLEKAIDAHNSIVNTFPFFLPSVHDKKEYEKLITLILEKMPSEMVNKYYAMHREKMYEARNELKLIPQIVEFIQNCSIPSVILTSTYEKLVIDVLNNHSINSNFFLKIIGRETPGDKEKKLLEVIKMYSLNPYEVLGIGDSPSDFVFCDRVGIPFIAVTYGYFSCEYFDSKKILKICDIPDMLVSYLQRCFE